MENEFKIDGELFSENENLIQDNGENTEISDVETFEGLGDILNEEEETPVEETPKVEEPKKEEPKKEVNEDTTPYQDIVSHFQSKGIFGDISEYEDEEFTFDGSEESFVELLERKKEKDAVDFLYKEILPQLPASVKKKVDLMFESELDAESADVLGDKIDKYSSLNKESFDKDVESAKAVYKEYLKTRGFDDDEIEDAVSKAVDLEEISDKAEKARIKLLDIANKEIANKAQEIKIQEQKREEAQKQKLQSMKASISAFREKINKEGFPVNEKIVDEIFKSRTEIVGKSKDNRPLNKIGVLSERDPEGFQNALHLLTAMDYFSLDKNGNIKPNFDKLTKSAQSKAVKKVGSDIEKITSKFAPVGTKRRSDVDQDEEDILSDLNSVFNT
jgi:hypothetical protein